MKERILKFLNGRNIYCIISVAIFIGLITLGTFLLGPYIINLASDPEKLRYSLGTSGIKSHVIFIAIQITQTIFALIPGEVVELAASYLFGSILGLILCLIGVGIATTIIFGLTRLLGRKFAEIMIDKRDLKRLRFLQDEKKLGIMFALLFFIPGTPKDLITYFAGITKIKFGTFMLICMFCRIPSILTSTLAGEALGEQSYLRSILIFTVTGVVAIFGVIIYRRISSKPKH